MLLIPKITILWISGAEDLIRASCVKKQRRPLPLKQCVVFKSLQIYHQIRKRGYAFFHLDLYGHRNYIYFAFLVLVSLHTDTRMVVGIKIIFSKIFAKEHLAIAR